MSPVVGDRHDGVGEDTIERRPSQAHVLRQLSERGLPLKSERLPGFIMLAAQRDVKDQVVELERAHGITPSAVQSLTQRARAIPLA